MMFLKRYAIVFLFVIYAPIKSSSQVNSNSDTINQIDDNGKKHGYWIEYLNKSLMTVKKKKKAKYYWYVRYQNGIRFETDIVTKGYIPGVHVQIENQQEQNSPYPILLNGKYSILNKFSDRKFMTCTFDNGLPQIWTIHSRDSCEYVVNFENKYGGNGLSHSTEEFNYDGRLFRRFYMILDEKEWSRVYY